MPDLASRRLANTSCVLLPMDETMPIPVTTTRLMDASRMTARLEWRCQQDIGTLLRVCLQLRTLAEQSDLEIEGSVDHRAVGGEPTVSNAKHKPRPHDPLDINPVHDVLHGREDLPGELELAEPERATLAVPAEPAQEKTDQLPQSIEAEATR